MIPLQIINLKYLPTKNTKFLICISILIYFLLIFYILYSLYFNRIFFALLMYPVDGYKLFINIIVV